MAYTMAVDAGNYNVKVCTNNGVYKFCSAICEYDELNVQQIYGNDDMTWEYDGVRGFAGTIAKYEDEFGNGATYGNSKNHFDAKMRTLLAIHRYATSSTINLIVAQPIITHTQVEKEEIISSLVGEHILTVNNIEKKFEIKDVRVAAEGAISYYSNVVYEPNCRIIDCGSGTVNCVTYKDKKFINRDSVTLEFGAETSLNGDINIEAMAKGIHRNMSKKWKITDKIYLCGGPSEKIISSIRTFYKNVELMKPIIKDGHSAKIVHPEFANVVGMYNLGTLIWPQ